MSKNVTASMTFISEGTQITGEISVEHDLRVEGAIKGAVSVGGSLVLGPTGRVEGDVTARSATLAGHVTGNLRAHEKLVLEGKSVLLGDLQTRELVIQEGAIFQGRSVMDARPDWINCFDFIFTQACPMNPPDKKPSSNLGFLLTLGGSLAVWLAGGVFLGRWADHHWNLTPWGTVVGAILGFAGAGYSVFREVQRMDRNE